jgi:hypothetical protein
MKTTVTLLLAFGAVLPLRSQEVTFKSNGQVAALVELYSSEGCSSCPPAEAWMNGLEESPGLWKDIFPIAFHVDYWDGLGWPDRFASADYTRRQQAYSDRFGSASVYTPEFIVNGREWRRSWLGGEEPPKAETGKAGELTVNVSQNRISAEFAPGPAAPKEALSLNVALLGFDLSTDVKAGENSGRRLAHDFVVLGFGSSPLALQSDGRLGAPLEIKTTTRDEPGAIVAWVSGDDGTIVQIAGGWLRSATRPADR